MKKLTEQDKMRNIEERNVEINRTRRNKQNIIKTEQFKLSQSRRKCRKQCQEIINYIAFNKNVLEFKRDIPEIKIQQKQQF